MATKRMTKAQVKAKCPDCADSMGDDESTEMKVDDESGEMQHRHATKTPAEYSNAINGVEIFKTGTHNGDTYTESDLDDMVEAFGALDYRPAIKVGHSKDKPGAPSYGWVQNVKRVGSKLVADFTDMHDSVVDAIRKRSYDRVSSEIYFNLKRGGKTFGKALKAVALLGAEVPAVAGLTPLHKMEFAEEGEFASVAACEQALDVPSSAICDTLAERMARMIKEYGDKPGHDFRGNQWGSNGGKSEPDQKKHLLSSLAKKFPGQVVKTKFSSDGETIDLSVGKNKYRMEVGSDDGAFVFQPVGHKGKPIRVPFKSYKVTKPAHFIKKEKLMNLKDLKAKLKLLNEQMQSVIASGDDDRDDKITELGEQSTALLAQIDEMEAVAGDDAAKKALKDANDAITAANARVAELEAKDRARDTDAKVGAIKVPAFRPAVAALYAYALEHADVRVKVYSTDKEGKKTEAEQTLVDIADGVVAQINAHSEKLFKQIASTGDQPREEGQFEDNAADELHKRIKEYLAKNPTVKSYSAAMDLILSSDATLAKSYAEQTAANAAVKH